MAGSQDPNDNPVAINVVPMVDVIFCLCVFFMCSFKFKQVEGKFESWLPKTGDTDPYPAGSPMPPEIRIAMFWDEAAQKSVTKHQTKFVQDEAQLSRIIREAHADSLRLNGAEVPVTIDADPRVPWQDVVAVVNVAKSGGVTKLEFAYGAPVAATVSFIEKR